MKTPIESGFDDPTQNPWRPLIKGERAQTGDKIAVLLGGMRDPQPWDWPHVECTHQSFWRTQRSIADAGIAIKTTQDEPDWRPLEPGEIIQEGDQLQSNPIYVENAKWRGCVDSVGKTPENFPALEFRTRRPKPTPETPEPACPACVQSDGQCLGCGLVEHGMPAGSEPHGSAVEWVKERLIKIHDDLDQECLVLEDRDALELARRCDAAEASLALESDNARQSREEIEALKADVAAAQAKAKEYREELEWLENEVPVIGHDSWSCSVDMAGNRWTLQFRNDGKRERIRGRTLIETISKARAALAKYQPPTNNL